MSRLKRKRDRAPKMLGLGRRKPTPKMLGATATYVVIDELDETMTTAIAMLARARLAEQVLIHVPTGMEASFTCPHCGSETYGSLDDECGWVCANAGCMYAAGPMKALEALALLLGTGGAPTSKEELDAAVVALTQYVIQEEPC